MTRNVERPESGSGEPCTAWTVETSSARASADAAPLATVFTEGRAHVVRHANAAFCRLVARGQEDIVDRPLDSVVGSDDGGALRDLLARVLDTRLPDVASDVELRDPLRSDRRRYITALASPIVNEQTHEPGLLVHVLDTTAQAHARFAEERAANETRLANEALVLAGLQEQEMAEAALRETARWNALVQNLGEGVTVLDDSGRPVLVNPVGLTLLDLRAPEDYLTRTFYTVAGVPLAPERHPAARALAGERFADEECVHQRADGSSIRLLFSGSSVQDESGAVVLAVNVYRDVTALRQLEETRQEYVALISHDLRNPLHALLLNSQLLIQSLDEPGKEALAAESRYARGIERVTRRLAAMVDELYQSSQLEAGQQQLRVEPTAPGYLLAELADRIGAPQDRARLVVAPAPPDLPLVYVDASRIARALDNLVTNALKYSAPGSKVHLEAARTADRVVFTVRDEGPGIGPQDLPRVFEKYHRARVTTDREGMGLGLYITRRIVEAHGGQVSVESAIGRGSTFRIALPIRDAGAIARPGVRKAVPRPGEQPRASMAKQSTNVRR